MKNIYLIILLLFSSLVSFAQVDFFDGTLENAFKKAKIENKPVVVMISMTTG